MTSRTILDLDLRRIITILESRYKVRLPRRVLAVDYSDRGDLYIRFRHVEMPIGEPAEDGLAIFFYEGDGRQVVAVEVLDLSSLVQQSPAPGRLAGR